MGAEAFAEALKENTTLEELLLPHNRIEALGTKALASALARNMSLRRLDLTHNNLCEDAANSLATALKQNHTLQYLHLNDNDIRGAGAERLAEAIEENDALIWLDIANNDISLNTKVFEKTLRVNRTLQHLDLYVNWLDHGNSSPGKGLLNALKQNQTLTFLKFGSTLSHNKEDEELLLEAIEENYSIQYLQTRYIYDDEDQEGIQINLSKWRQILERNKEISKCISLLHSHLYQHSLEATSIDEAIHKLQNLIPSIGTEQAPFEDTHPVAENYRLCIGLSYALQADSTSIQHALELFNQPFTHPTLQELADRVLGEALFVLDKTDLKLEIQLTCYQLALYYLRTLLNHPQFSTIIKTCLYNLTNPGVNPPSNINSLLIKNIIGAELIRYDDALTIGTEALQLSHDLQEGIILRGLLLKTIYDPTTCHSFWQCPSFREAFKRHYPKTSTFQVLEDIVHTTSSDEKRNTTKRQVDAALHQFSVNDPLEKPFIFNDYIIKKQQVIVEALNMKNVGSNNLTKIPNSSLNTGSMVNNSEKNEIQNNISEPVNLQDLSNNEMLPRDPMVIESSLYDHKRKRSNSEERTFLTDAGQVFFNTKKQKTDDSDEKEKVNLNGKKLF
jgi:hypothetical protein